MAKILPPPPRKTPKDLRPIIEQWLEAKAKAKQWDEEEYNLRKFLAAQLFPNLKEGINRLTKEGYEAVCTRKVYRKVDKAAFSTMAAELRKKGLNLDVLIEMQPSLVLKSYRELDERKRKLFESVLTITDASPTLDINIGK